MLIRKESKQVWGFISEEWNRLGSGSKCVARFAYTCFLDFRAPAMDTYSLLLGGQRSQSALPALAASQVILVQNIQCALVGGISWGNLPWVSKVGKRCLLSVV